MIKDLYTFSKTAWHVKLFKWVYGTDPTQTFNTMCPYFWSMVATLIFFPLILFVKLFGKSGTALLKSLEAGKRNRRAKFEADFIAKCSKVMTDKEAYDLFKSKCWDNERWLIDYEVRNAIQGQYYRHSDYLRAIEREKDKKAAARQEKVAEIKESKWFVALAYVITASMTGLLLYSIFIFFASVTFAPVDWDAVGLFFKIMGGVIGTALLIIGLFRYIFIPITNWLKCIKLPACRLCKLGLGKYFAAPFIFIGKGIAIICDMIYMSYKQACPRITWTSDENKQ